MTRRHAATMIPLFHDFSDATVLVFGGGSVGARKARAFAREARVVVVAPAFAGEEFGGAERVRAAPAPGDAGGWIDRTGATLVVAATDDADLNAAVAAAARERGVLVNRADRRGGREPGSVVLPATAREGAVTVAVGTDGTSPALAAYLREELAAEIEGAGAMAALLEDLHAELCDRGVSDQQRRSALRAVVRCSSVWKALRTGTTNPRDEAAVVLRKTLGGEEG